MTLGDVERRRVRQRAFQAVTDLNKHLAILDEHKEHHAIAAFLLTDTPRLCHALGVVRDVRVALHFWQNRDHDLIRSFPLEFGELLVKTISGFL